MAVHNLAWKKSEYETVRAHLGKYPVAAVADLAGFPASQFQALRKKLQGRAVMKVSKMRVIKRALNDAGLQNLAGATEGSCVLIFTDMNPFEIFAFLKRNKGMAAAKEGAAAQRDIVIPAGDTGLPPGPALSDLKAAGLSVRIQGATIAVSEDKVVARAGEPITAAVASVLSKLDIKPIEVRLRVIAALEGGQLYSAEVLDIDTTEVFNRFRTAYSSSFALALEAGYPTKETVKVLVQRAYSNAKALALEAGVCTKETVGILLARARAQAESLKEKGAGTAAAEAAEGKPAEEVEKSGGKNARGVPAAEEAEKAGEETPESKAGEKPEGKAAGGKPAQARN